MDAFLRAQRGGAASGWASHLGALGGMGGMVGGGGMGGIGRVRGVGGIGGIGGVGAVGVPATLAAFVRGGGPAAGMGAGMGGVLGSPSTIHLTSLPTLPSNLQVVRAQQLQRMLMGMGGGGANAWDGGGWGVVK